MDLRGEADHDQAAILCAAAFRSQAGAAVGVMHDKPWKPAESQSSWCKAGSSR
jgi:hypothetical protein